MVRPANRLDVYLEVGKKRTFAGLLEWPGWCRSGRDEEAALQALLAYGPRYVRVLGLARLELHLPDCAAGFAVVERLVGDAATDFGAPGKAPSSDGRPVDAAEVKRFCTLLEGCWRTFDAAVLAAAGKELRKGPRGGGRETDEIVRHVLEADAAYLSQVGIRVAGGEENDTRAALEQTREAIPEAVAWAAAGEGPARGPRGGVRWTARYFVRRLAWHVLDHAWEIEDRTPMG
jgi:hypothetical protein